MGTTNIGSQGFAKLVDNVIRFAIQFYSDPEGNSLANALEVESTPEDPNSTPATGTETDDKDKSHSVDRAQVLTAEFELTGDIRKSNEAISILETVLEQTSPNDPERHFILFNLSLALCRRVEIQMSNTAQETLLDQHRSLSRCLFLLRQAVNASPATLKVKIQYLGQIGHTATLWSTVLSSKWSEAEVLALLAQLRADRDAEEDPTKEKITGFVFAVIMASTLSTAYGATQDPEYRTEGRSVYRHTLSSIRDILPLDSIINPNMGFFSILQALAFIKDGVIPFIVQVMAVLQQSLVEVPLSAVVGRRAAAIAMDKGFYQQGVEWLEQCLTLIWGQLNLRPPTPLGVTSFKAEPEDGMERIVHAFLGLCVYVDVVGDKGTSIARPEQLGYFLIKEWLRLREEALKNPIYRDLFKQHSFNHILNAARTTPVVMLNLWGTQCDALILYGEGKSECFRLEGVSEDFAAKLQTNFREGLQSGHFRSRGDEQGDELSDNYRGSALAARSPVIHRVMAALWNKVVKPVLDKMNLKPVENAEDDPPRLTWCPTGPSSFFPLHAAGIYTSQEKGTKIYDYVASSYTPTLSILADASVALSDEPEPFKGILAVSQPAKDGQTPIPLTRTEVQAVINAVEVVKSVEGVALNWTWLQEAEATKQAVLSGMESNTWVHLACHARQYPLNTSESAFMLANGEILSLADISAQGAAHGELAFLSACQTAAGDYDLSEEGVHLAAGMLVAGYRSVIATTWSVRDEDAPVVSQAVYGRLLEGGQIKRRGTALALHHATRLLREKVGDDQVMRWATFIHLGI